LPRSQRDRKTAVAFVDRNIAALHAYGREFTIGIHGKSCAFYDGNHVLGDDAEMFDIARVDIGGQSPPCLQDPRVVAPRSRRYLDLSVALKLNNLLSGAKGDLSIRACANNSAILDDLAPFNGLPLTIDHHQHDAAKTVRLPFPGMRCPDHACA
jgi:hypothetical protein